MQRKTVSAIVSILLLTSMLALAFNVQPARASGTIYIKADGSIDPSTAPITSLDNITYTFTDNIYDEIRVQRSDIVVDGKGYTLEGSGTHQYGVYVYAVNNVSIQNVNISNFTYGVFLKSSSFNVVSGNNMTNNGRGIQLLSSSNNTVFENNLIANDWGGGIMVWGGSNNNNIYANNLTMNQPAGINLSSSSSNSIRENNIESNSGPGLWVASSNNNSIFGNNIRKNPHGVFIASSSANKVFGNNITESSNYGVYLSESLANRISGNNIAASSFGVWFQASSSFNLIIGNNITTNGDGIYLSGHTGGSCDNNSISANRITSNQRNGIMVYTSFNNIFSENNITANGDSGIRLYISSGSNTFHKNTIKDNNEWGIYIESCSSNRFYHNNLINNTHQASCNLGYTNIWDDGYPSGGNYWDDYTDTDQYGGPYQNVTGRDGIWDNAYIINEYNMDRYPFAEPWGTNSYNVTVKAHCNTEDMDVSVNIDIDGSQTSYVTPHTFTNLTGTHTFTVPDIDLSGHLFKQWSTGQTITTITVSVNGTYIAYYQAKFNLNITTTTGGTTNPPLGNYSYWDGTKMNVTATPSLGYILDHWELDEINVGAPNPINVTMNVNHTLHAVFLWLGICNLTVTTTAGGTTIPAPGIYSYNNGTMVNVTAIPDIGYIFDYWELDGVDVGSANPYLVPMDNNHTLHAIFAIHDVAIVNVTPSKSIVGQGYSLNINVTVANQGDYTETFNVTVYANATEIETRELTLTSDNSTTLTFSWNTASWIKGYYTISAYAWPVPSEIDNTDNTRSGGNVIVAMVGDITGPTQFVPDGKVDGRDIALVAKYFGSVSGYPPNVDIYEDGKIDGRDIAIVSKYFGTVDP